MIWSHFFRSSMKLELVVDSMRRRASSPSITRPQLGVALHPFWGALISTSTPADSMSTHRAPEAMQSRTIIPPAA